MFFLFVVLGSSSKAKDLLSQSFYLSQNHIQAKFCQNAKGLRQTRVKVV